MGSSTNSTLGSRTNSRRNIKAFALSAEIVFQAEIQLSDFGFHSDPDQPANHYTFGDFNCQAGYQNKVWRCKTGSHILLIPQSGDHPD